MDILFSHSNRKYIHYIHCTVETDELFPETGGGSRLSIIIGDGITLDQVVHDSQGYVTIKI